MLAVGGGTGEPAGALLSRPQRKMRVAIARVGDSPDAGLDSTMVISSPVSTACTWKAVTPLASCHVFSNLQR